MPYRASLPRRNGHLNTIAGHFNRGRLPPYRRQRVHTADGDFFDVDRLPAPAGGAPRLVALHGLGGNSGSAYLRRLMRAATGWDRAILHARSCSGDPNHRLQSFHAGFIDDVDALLRMERARAPHLPLVAVGFSLGGSQLANWLGRTPDAHEIVDAAVLISPPIRLAPAATAIDEGLNRPLYGRRFLKNLQSLVAAKAAAFPDARGQIEAALSARNMWEYDDRWTGPVHGFSGARDYYERAQSAPWIRHIRVPTRVLHAADDPFIPVAAVPDEAFVGAEHATLVRTPHGGHVGFQKASRRGQPGWLERWIVDSLMALAADQGRSLTPPVGHRA